MFALSRDIGIDLGTASVLVYMKDEGIVLNEPSVVAIDRNTDKILAVGDEAKRMVGRTPGDIVAVRPMSAGVISDYDITEKMLKYFIQKACGGGIIMRPRIMICIPSEVTQVQKRAVIDAAVHAGARRAFLIEEPIAAAIGAGLDIEKPCGNMVVDIGGGTTDVAVISLGNAVVSKSIKVAGNNFDDAIIRYIRRKYNIIIGDRTAEEIKINIGSAYEKDKEEFMTVKGRSLISGLPKSFDISSKEVTEALQEPLADIIDIVHSVLEKTPPELAADICDRGIVLTGGGSLLHGLDKLLEEKMDVPVILANDPISCVALGTGKALDSLPLMEDHETVVDAFKIK
ncbi:rod shape-determining protein [Thermoanaerobacterium thermosaccharolyticum]|uniref:Cell shape-determining protein MreB n=2 Tax=Thermoanaerobacterium thermosaccharolyticum TaxID=1517 RepID=A0A231VM94_THETR|nr:rod shape-determining protein [Thermoanaerobacterium thermosaccharolyticum]TCW36525.1 rod shape-determining protein MreB [Thermohydrogenium kirishiense]AGB20127.1 cell shape determining protein, MreB/Mrl family [Thermoanaerobacterium thermosaccharolyticum M0795]AST57187.1 Cell shape determining protein, MreB/Mrl family [Thermoanaerobacterium thermosaccharolyticum]KAA5807494.1 rod shape-determining protein [Thermoanaerobacterium thermosaccharolyticum]OXT09209.1 rod shape-determining protein 